MFVRRLRYSCGRIRRGALASFWVVVIVTVVVTVPSGLVPVEQPVIKIITRAIIKAVRTLILPFSSPAPLIA